MIWHPAPIVPSYNLSIIPISALSFVGNSPASVQGGNGSDWQFTSYSFSIDNTASQTGSVIDDDTDFQDDPANPGWSGGTFAAHQQVLGSPLTIGGVTYPAGMQIEDEYELDVTGPGGIIYRMVAVSMFDGSSFTVVGFTFDGPVPPGNTQLTSVPGSNQEGAAMPPSVACFAAGTLIATTDGQSPIEQIQVGDRVCTRDGGTDTILWTGRRRVGRRELAAYPHLRPIRVAQGALGAGLPLRDLILSPQHRILVQSAIVARMVGGRGEALLAVKHLVGLVGIKVDHAAEFVTYHHLMCQNHQVILAEGAPAETLLPGPQALLMLGAEARAEVLALLPDLSMTGFNPRPALPVLGGQQARSLMQRHARTEKPLLQPLATDQRLQHYPNA